MSRHNERGHEILDQTPIERPVGFHRPPNLTEQIQRMVRSELSLRASQAGAESFEEADDFDIDDDPPDPASPWELNFDQAAEPVPPKTPKKQPVKPAEPDPPDEPPADPPEPVHPT